MLRILLLTLLPVLVCLSTEQSERLTRILTKSYQDYEAEKYEDAIKGSLEVVKYVQHVTALSILSTCYGRLGQHKKSLKYQKKLLKLEPDNAVRYHETAILFSEIGRYDKSVMYAKQAVKKNPAELDHSDLLAHSLVAAGRYEEAATVFESMLRTFPQHGPAAFQLGWIRKVILDVNPITGAPRVEKQKKLRKVKSAVVPNKSKLPGKKGKKIVRVKKLQEKTKGHSESGDASLDPDIMALRGETPFELKVVNDWPNNLNCLYDGWVPSGQYPEFPTVHIDNLKISRFTQHRTQRKPLLIKGSAFDHLGWDVPDWTLKNLLKEHGSLRVNSQRRSHPLHPFGISSRVSLKFREFMESIDFKMPSTRTADPTRKPDHSTILEDTVDFPLKHNLYLNLQQNGKRGPSVLMKAFQDALPDPWFLDTDDIIRSNMWIGNAHPNPAYAGSGLHFDNHDNLYIVLQGAKHFQLIPPTHIEDIYLNGDARQVAPCGKVFDLMAGPENHQTSSHFSRVDPYLYQDEAFKKLYPRFQRAMSASLNITVEAGDMLFLPAGWVHYVTSFGHHIAVNYFLDVGEQCGDLNYEVPISM